MPAGPPPAARVPCDMSEQEFLAALTANELRIADCGLRI